MAAPMKMTVGACAASSLECAASCKKPRVLTSEIIDTIAIEVLLKHQDPETWFFFDIDNVLTTNPEQLGSDQWFRWRCAYAKECGESFSKALNHWTALQLLTDLKPVEEKTVAVVKQLQQNGFPSMALTSRGIRLCSRTVEQLHNVGIDFNVNPIHKEEIFWPRGLTNEEREHVLFERGILFSSGQDKGLALEKLLEKCDEKPERIVYIDDHRHHVENVARACNTLGIHFIGYHYRYLEPQVKAFDVKTAIEQLNQFPK